MQFPIPHASLQANLHLLKIDLLSPLVDSLIQVSEVGCSICCIRGRGRLARDRKVLDISVHTSAVYASRHRGCFCPPGTGGSEGGCTTSLVVACEAPAGLDRGSQPYSNAVGIAVWLV